MNRFVYAFCVSVSSLCILALSLLLTLWATGLLSYKGAVSYNLASLTYGWPYIIAPILLSAACIFLGGLKAHARNTSLMAEIQRNALFIIIIVFMIGLLAVIPGFSDIKM